jgi:simple sugar transport system permease protein
LSASAVAVARPKAHWGFVASPIFAPLVTQILIWIVFWSFVPNFGSLRTLSGIVGAASINAVVVIGVTMLMICGEFDLSVGPMIAVGAFIFADMLQAGASPILAVLAAVAVTACLGAVNGLLTVTTGIPSFIVTLGTRAIFRGGVWLYSGGNMRQFTERMPVQDVLNGRLDVVNNLFTLANFRTGTLWALGLGIILQIVLTRTAFGSHVFAVGGNPGAALTQGISTKRVKVLCFILTGALAGFAGILTFSEFSTVLVVTGANVELRVIAAAVIGGTLLTGGAGSIIGGLLGIVLINLLRSGAILLGLPSDNFEAIVGVTIVGAALLNDWIVRRSAAVS